MEIPAQLKNEKFILVEPKGKKPIEKWGNPEFQYSFNSEKLLNHIKNGGNYGVLCGGTNSLVVIDFDEVDDTIIDEFKQHFGDTFTVKTRRGWHLYYYVPGYTGGIRIDFEKGHADIRSDGQCVIGPGSTHPSGAKYEVVSDLPIKVLNFRKFTEWIGKYKKQPEPVATAPETEFVFDINQMPFWARAKYQDAISRDEELREMIMGKVPSRFPSRSERDYYAIFKLIGYGLWRFIPAIFLASPIGEKMREHPNPRHYIIRSIRTACEKYGIKDYPQLPNIMAKIYMAKDKQALALVTDSIIRELAEIGDKTVHEYVISEISKRTGMSKKHLWRQLKKVLEKSSEPEVEDIGKLLSEEVKEVEYWLEPYVPKGALIIIGGKPGSFKSNIVLMFSLLLASKNSYAGRIFKRRGTPRILIYDLENDRQTRIARLKYLTNGMAVDVGNNVFFYSHFSKYDIESELARCKEYDIIVLDSYRRFLEGSENDSEVTNQFYRNFLKPLKDMGKTIIIVHHFRKLPTDAEYVEEVLIDAFRGSTDIVSQVDIAYAVIKTPTKYADGKLEFSVFLMPAKNRQGVPVSPLRLDIKKDDIRMSTEIVAIRTSVAASSSYLKSVIIKKLESQENAVNKPMLIREVAHETGYSERHVRRVLDDMKNTGIVSYEGKNVSLEPDMAMLFKEEPEAVKCLVGGDKRISEMKKFLDENGGEAEAHVLKKKFGDEFVASLVREGILFEPREGILKMLGGVWEWD